MSVQTEWWPSAPWSAAPELQLPPCWMGSSQRCQAPPAQTREQRSVPIHMQELLSEQAPQHSIGRVWGWHWQVTCHYHARQPQGSCRRHQALGRETLECLPLNNAAHGQGNAKILHREWLPINVPACVAAAGRTLEAQEVHRRDLPDSMWLRSVIQLHQAGHMEQWQMVPVRR